MHMTHDLPWKLSGYSGSYSDSYSKHLNALEREYKTVPSHFFSLFVSRDESVKKSFLV
jgi:hypothetical protein